MNKSELVRSIAANSGADKDTVAGIVDAVFDTITERLAEGEKVQIHEFGTFKRHLRPARTYRNPRTGEKLEKGASYDGRFASYEKLEERLNS